MEEKTAFHILGDPECQGVEWNTFPEPYKPDSVHWLCTFKQKDEYGIYDSKYYVKWGPEYDADSFDVLMSAYAPRLSPEKRISPYAFDVREEIASALVGLIRYEHCPDEVGPSDETVRLYASWPNLRKQFPALLRFIEKNCEKCRLCLSLIRQTRAL